MIALKPIATDSGEDVITCWSKHELLGGGMKDREDGSRTVARGFRSTLNKTLEEHVMVRVAREAGSCHHYPAALEVG
jgi:hypothetical protein